MQILHFVPGHAPELAVTAESPRESGGVFWPDIERSNEILQFLTIISAVFLPLNLLAGLFGMNFPHLPLLQTWYGPGIVAVLMITTVTGLLLWFRHRKWI